MFIAFKWLVSFALIMWMVMCCCGVFMRVNTKMSNTVDETKHFEGILNVSKRNDDKLIGTRENSQQLYAKQQSFLELQIIMVVAGAAAVTVFHKKEKNITFTQQKISVKDIRSVAKIKIARLKTTSYILAVFISKRLNMFTKKIIMVLVNVARYIYTLKVKNTIKQSKIHLILLNKLKEMGEERKNLGQLLISAIHENKDIRMRYQLETMSKNRLLQHIEDTQRQIKENRSRYVNFQQLYLLTHQENMYLKSRLRKLTKEKKDAEKSLMGLMNEVYRSNNKELKVYCSRFIVKSKDNLLNSDVSADIREFLAKTRDSSGVTSEWVNSEQSNVKITPIETWLSCGPTRIREILNEDNSLVPVGASAPRLKGLPGEHVWTVKDKNGLIEKLYEYDYESDFDNGDTIRRIRQYSVYYDKDCLLDFTKMEQNVESRDEFNGHLHKFDCPSTNHKIVTGSEAFRKFLQNSHTSLVSPRPPMLCS